MPAAVSPMTGVESGNAPRDDLDGLFDDLLQENSNANNTNANPHSNDIDEEVKITKKRKPVAKLDENRLLSAAGIPKLRKISKQKFKFRGKGHEFTDMAKLLNTYQLWLDDMFPKAKFLDGLAMVEKLGHKKKIQIYRKEWIDEGKPRTIEDDLDDLIGSREEPAVTTQSNGADAQTEQIFEPDEDELDALMGAAPVQHEKTAAGPQQEQEPDMDELDALLAEQQEADTGQKSLFRGPTQADNDFADEEEAMAGMEW
ncbi:hypothetical protein AAFC00_001528 [Neodothiora populina]|uniref:Chromosome segregation in meiosis protein n=1 Tax=Neodothiora populina TaxID=2781224 RepID=A0ABR3PP80_9PEZI